MSITPSLAVAAEIYFPGSDCSVTFFIYHSSTVGRNLVDKDTAHL